MAHLALSAGGCTKESASKQQDEQQDEQLDELRLRPQLRHHLDVQDHEEHRDEQEEAEEEEEDELEEENVAHSLIKVDNGDVKPAPPDLSVHLNRVPPEEEGDHEEDHDEDEEEEEDEDDDEDDDDDDDDEEEEDDDDEELDGMDDEEEEDVDLLMRGSGEADLEEQQARHQLRRFSEQALELSLPASKRRRSSHLIGSNQATPSITSATTISTNSNAKQTTASSTSSCSSAAALSSMAKGSRAAREMLGGDQFGAPQASFAHNDSNNNTSAGGEHLVKQLARIEHQLVQLEDRFIGQDRCLLAMEAANRDLLLKLSHVSLVLESLASPGAIAAAIAAATAAATSQSDQNNNNNNNNNNNSSSSNNNTGSSNNQSQLHQLAGSADSRQAQSLGQRLLEQLHQKPGQPGIYQMASNKGITGCGSTNTTTNNTISNNNNNSIVSSVNSSPSVSPVEPHSHHLQLHQHLSRQHRQVLGLNLNQNQNHHQNNHLKQQHHSLLHLGSSTSNQDTLNEHSSANSSNHSNTSSLAGNLAANGAGSQRRGQQLPLALAGNQANCANNGTGHLLGAGASLSRHSSASVSPSLGARSALSTSAGSPIGSSCAPSNGAGGASVQHQLAAVGQHQQQDPQSTAAAMAAASQFLTALARSQVGGQLGDLDHLTQSHLLASTLNAAAQANVSAEAVATNLSNHLAKQQANYAASNNLSHSQLNHDQASELTTSSQQQQQARQTLNQSVAHQLASAAAASAGSPSAVAAAAVAAQLSAAVNQRALGSSAGPNSGNQGAQNAPVGYSIPHPHSHHALSHPAASLLINNPHYQTVRTKYSTRRYSRRRVGPQEALADPAIRATVQLKMPVVPKTILIVLKHRLTVQTAITLACAQTNERLRKGAIQKKLEAMFREPGAVDSFLAEWDHPRLQV